MKLPHGFAYIALLLVLAIMALALTSASENIEQHAKREREQQLFFVGEQFRNAIASYYESSPAGIKQFPKSFNNLLIDKRAINPVKHLRQLYRDPMTNKQLWGLVKNEQQQILGVYSVSSEPLLKINFNSNIVTVDLKQESAVLIYSDLKFIYTPDSRANNLNDL